MHVRNDDDVTYEWGEQALAVGVAAGANEEAVRVGSLADRLSAFGYPPCVTRMIVLPGIRRSGANAEARAEPMIFGALVAGPAIAVRPGFQRRCA